MMDPLFPSGSLPLSQEQWGRLQQIVSECSPQQLSWLSGYFWGLTYCPSQQMSPVGQAELGEKQPEPAMNITIISASQTGNARRVAEELFQDLSALPLSVRLMQASEYPYRRLADEQFLIIVISTQGEGEPPEEAIPLYQYLFSKKASRLAQTKFAVFSLGDSSYEFFCQAGKHVDQQLEVLGAERLLERVDADIDYTTVAQQWREKIGVLLKETAQSSNTSTLAVNNDKSPIESTATSSLYSKTNPFSGELLLRQKITGRDSQKDVQHLEIDLSMSGLTYQPGDTLGIWYENDPLLIEEILNYLNLTGEERVDTQHGAITLLDALRYHYELTQNTRSIIEKYAVFSQHEALNQQCSDQHGLQQYAFYTPIVDMIRYFPCQLTAQQLISLLRPLSPRLYSISSSQEEVGDEVHITVGVVRYHVDAFLRCGGASGYLAERVQQGSRVKLFIESNPNFRLPPQGNTAVIMIGAGTGIAPFRAFMQQRAALNMSGKTWLFFGNQHFTQDFLYQREWQIYLQQGVLTKIDLAWSRDQKSKVYVQDLLLQKAVEVWQWLQQGAHIYVCGDRNGMAKGVQKALLEVIRTQGHYSMEEAEVYLNDLRYAKRYQRDVY